MTDLPASPRATRLVAPGWLDGRLVLGVLLVLVSVVVGARLLMTADRSTRVWVATRDLAPGTTLSGGDLSPGRVRLFGDGNRYLAAVGAPPTGYVLTRGVGAAELLPRHALVGPGQTGRPLREVSVPAAPAHLPEDLQAGQQVDVYVTPGTAGSAAVPAAGPAGTTRLVLSGVPVRARQRDASLAAGAVSAVVLSVGDDQAALLVTALQQGGVDLVRVPRDSETVPLPAPSPTSR